MLTGSILTRRRKKRATPNTETTNGFAWRKCGEVRGFCLTWWRQWRERSKSLTALELLSEAILVILFDDEVIGHAGDVIADLPRKGLPFGFLMIVVRQG